MKLDSLHENKSRQKTENDDMHKTPAPGELGQYISTAQAAKILKVNMSRIRQLIGDGTLKSYQPEKGRRDHMLKLSEVRAYEKTDRSPGRPNEGSDNDKD